jgi:hypothetical protein
MGLALSLGLGFGLTLLFLYPLARLDARAVARFRLIRLMIVSSVAVVTVGAYGLLAAGLLVRARFIGAGAAALIAILGIVLVAASWQLRSSGVSDRMKLVGCGSLSVWTVGALLVLFAFASTTSVLG